MSTLRTESRGRGVSLLVAISLACTLLLAPSAAGAETYVGTVDVEVGRTRVVNTPNIDRVAIGTRGLVEVRAFPRIGQILLIGRQAGATDLRVWNQDGGHVRYRLQIRPRQINARKPISAEELSRLFEDVSGIEVIPLEQGRVAITGQARRTVDYERARMLAEQFDSVINQVSEPAVTLEATILVEARILEVRRNQLDRVGINWNNAVNGPVFGWLSDWDSNSVFRPQLPPGIELTAGATGLPGDVGSNTFAGWAGSWESVVDLLREDGVAKLLSEPKLTTINGKSASFHSGGQIPVQTVDGEGNLSVEYKDFGISLDIEPVADRSGLIRTDVRVEVSSIDDSIAINGQPGLSSRTTETVMNAHAGQSMVISGLFSHEESKDVDAVPGISRIPFIGELFKTRAWRDQQNELVIIVTPYLVTPETPAMKEMERDAIALMERAGVDLNYTIYD